MRKKRNLYTKPQQYKNITLSLINRGYGEYGAMRYIMNFTRQNIWIPKQYLEEDGRLKENIDIDFVFKKHVNPMFIAGYDQLGEFHDDHFKVVIAGGRDFDDYNLLRRKCDRLLSRITRPITIISGGAKGADTLGERYAKERGYNLVTMPANWDKHKRSAGHIRNREMANKADAVVAFWDNSSPGTRGMIEYSKQIQLKVRVIHYDKA